MAQYDGLMPKFIHTHSWDGLKTDERIPRFPSQIGEKRKIRIHISTWVGISIGAKHYHLKVEEEENAWWDETQNAWVTVTCDSSKNGYSLEADLFTKKEAEKLADYFVKLIMGKNKDLYDVVFVNGLEDLD